MRWQVVRVVQVVQVVRVVLVLASTIGSQQTLRSLLLRREQPSGNLEPKWPRVRLMVRKL